MFEIAAAQYAFKLALAVTAIIAMNYTLRWLNHVTGNRFEQTLQEAPPHARLYYFGARLVGYAFIVGSVLS